MFKALNIPNFFIIMPRLSVYTLQGIVNYEFQLCKENLVENHIPPEVCDVRSEEHTSELQSRETISYAVFCLKKKKKKQKTKDKYNMTT